MKLRWNLASGFANSLWTGIVGLAAVPFYLRYLGIEAYGLIGFFTAMQALFSLLDMGLAPTINREVARCTTAGERTQVRDLLHTLAIAYWGVAALIAFASLAAAPLIGRHWLNSRAISTSNVSQAVMLMGLIIACRFPLGLYLGALMGAQRMAIASAIDMFMVTLGNGGAIAILALVSPTIEAFFVWQAIVSLLNVAVVRAAAWRAVHISKAEHTPRFDAASLERIWRFAAGMGITAVLSTIFLQSDKIVLSKIVNLEDLGRYTLAGLVARSLYLLVNPVFGATYPRMAALYAAGELNDIKILYKSGTRILMSLLFPIAILVTMFSKSILTIWTGHPEISQNIGPVVGFLLLGTVINGAMHFPYALQLAYGKSRLPATINFILLIAFVPLLFSLAINYGIVGGAAAWAILNIIYLFVGTWITHRTMLRGEGISWILSDIGIPLLLSSIVAGFGGYFINKVFVNIYTQALLSGILVISVVALVIFGSPNLLQQMRLFKRGVKSSNLRVGGH